MSNILSFSPKANNSNSLLDAAIANTEQLSQQNIISSDTSEQLPRFTSARQSTTAVAMLNNTYSDKNTSMFKTNKHFGLTSATIDPNYEGQTPTLEQWSKAADLDFKVIATKTDYTFDNPVTGVKVERKSKNNLFYRNDSGDEIGGGSDGYKLVQPATVVNFFNDLIEHYGFTIHKMGYCDNGSRIYAYASTDQHSWEVANGDKTLNHLLITTSFDGSSATTVQPFVESLYCFNQLPMAAKLFKPIRVSHSTNFNPNLVKLDLGIYGDACGKMRESLQKMARTKVTNQQALSMLYHTVKKADSIEQESTKTINTANKLFEKYLGTGIAANKQGRAGTVWGVLSAITEYNTHDRGRNENNRFKAMASGTVQSETKDAWDYMDRIAQEVEDIELVYLPA